MKKYLLSLLLGVVTSLGILAGCGDSDNAEIALAVVVGQHGNAMEIPMNAPSIKDAIYNSCYTYGSVAFVSVDGNPKVYYQTNIPEPEVGGLTENKKKSIANGYTEQLLGELQHAHPEVAEVDTLKAIQQAAFSLHGSSESADKVMVIMDSGLSTVGYVDFTKGLLQAEVQSIVDALKVAEAIPNMQDVKVVWMFLGQTARPQQELSERQKKKLQEIWTGILLEGGAKEVTFTSDIASETSAEVFPEVALVDVEERSISVDVVESIPVEMIVNEPIKTVILDNTSVQFVGDKAVFVDQEVAMSHIKDLATQLLKHPENKVYVIGTTASGNREFCNQLSIDRAQTVTDALIAMGVPESQLIPMGLGFEDPWHMNDLDDSGKQIESQACQNRKVLIVDVNGNDAKLLQ